MNIEMLQKSLIGAHLVKTIRVCDLIGLYFSTDAGVNTENVFYPYIHVQCWMRILQYDKLVVSSNEMYLALDIENTNFQYDTDESLFDEKMSAFVRCHNTSVITSVDVHDNGDAFLHFSDDCIIQIIANSTDEEDELWRFALDENCPHFICNVSGFELSE